MSDEKSVETGKSATVKKREEIIIPIIEAKNDVDILIAQTVLTDRLIESKREEYRIICKYEQMMLGKSVDECYVILNDFGIIPDIRITNIGGKIPRAKKNTISVVVNNAVDKVVVKVSQVGEKFIEQGKYLKEDSKISDIEDSKK